MSNPPQKCLPHMLLRRETGLERPGYCRRGLEQGDLKRQFETWREADFLHHCCATYATFQPAPRSTIALCYNCDGSMLASTHGDHTVKITSCHTSALSRVLHGHRRTPWVVRFHPRNPTLLASGSLDHEVRLWDAATGKCLAKHTFGKPIASLAFHVSVPVLAIACGHKVYMWEYTVQGSTPSIVLRTRRSTRAVHFHPHGLPVVLTAEVQDPSPLNQLPETLTEDKPFIASASAAPMMVGPHSVAPPALANPPTHRVEIIARPLGAPDNPSHDIAVPAAVAAVSPMLQAVAGPGMAAIRMEMPYATNPLPQSMVPLGREVPFPAVMPAAAAAAPEADGPDGLAAQLAAAYNASMWNLIGEDQPPRVRLRLWQFDPSKPAAELDERRGLRMEALDAVLCSEMGVHFSPCGRFLAATMACRGNVPPPEAGAGGPAATRPAAGGAAAGGVGGAAAEGMDWSPARSVWPQQGEAQQPVAAAAAVTPPHRPPPVPPLAPRPPHTRVVFEMRVMSMDGGSFGEVVRARRVRAAHCLTSVQFSPTGDHVLLAYGKKHSSLLRSLVVERGTLMPLHTILEVVSLPEMRLVRVLPSVEDEINAACFHPVPGGGVAYGTKEGRLRIVTHDRSSEGGGGGGGGAGGSASSNPAGSAANPLDDLPEVVLLEQGWLLLQEWERDRARRGQWMETRDAQRAAAEASANGGAASAASQPNNDAQ